MSLFLSVPPLLLLLLPVRLFSYDAAVQVRLGELGFTQFWNKPLLTNHTGCTYPPPAGAQEDDGERAQARRIRLSEI